MSIDENGKIHSDVEVIRSAVFGDMNVPTQRELDAISLMVRLHGKSVFDALDAALKVRHMYLLVSAVNQNIDKPREVKKEEAM